MEERLEAMSEAQAITTDDAIATREKIGHGSEGEGEGDSQVCYGSEVDTDSLITQ
jgi:hypothetical protein